MRPALAVVENPVTFESRNGFAALSIQYDIVCCRVCVLWFLYNVQKKIHVVFFGGGGEKGEGRGTH